MAAAVEDASGIDYHARGVNLACNDPFGFNLNAPFGKNHTVETAGNHHAVTFDLALDLGTFAQDDRLLRNDISFDIAVYAKRARDRKRPLKGHALVDETRPLFAAATLRRRTGPLPRHGNPQI